MQHAVSFRFLFADIAAIFVIGTTQLCRTQRRAARWVKEDYRMTSSVTIAMMLNDLTWSTLQKHRHESSLTMLYKFFK